jgi:hypothetical protein
MLILPLKLNRTKLNWSFIEEDELNKIYLNLCEKPELVRTKKIYIVSQELETKSNKYLIELMSNLKASPFGV